MYLGIMKNKLTPEQEQELARIAMEIQAEAIQMKIDYEKNPSEESGSVIHIHQDSTYLDEDESKVE
jgi:hypothetical protein